MAVAARSQRTKIGPRLFKVADRYFIRVPVPRSLRDVFSAEGRSAWEVFEPLKDEHGHPVIERREAERHCRRRGSEIDAEFAVKRQALSSKPKRRPLTPKDIERLAGLWLSNVMEEDEEVRRGGLDERDFSKLQESLDIVEAGGKEALARGDTLLVEFEVDDLAESQGFDVEKDSDTYRQLSYALLKASVKANDMMRARQQGEAVDTPAPPQAVTGDITLSQLITNYERDRGAAWTGKTRDGYTMIFRALKELIGADRGVRTITREDCRAVRDILVDLAPNYTKLPATRGKPMKEAAEISRTLDLPRRRPESINSYLNNLAALFNYAVEEEFMDRHPAKKLQVPVLTRKKDKKQPFDLGQLKAIFSAPLYTGSVDDAAGYAKPGPNVIRRGRFWVPLLSLWTGMRLNECCQLLVTDIRYLENVPVIIISEDSADDGIDDKRVKTEAGERYVPIHPELVRLGFLSHWQRMKDCHTVIYVDSVSSAGMA